MTQKLRDLIRSVRACKTAADERAVIAKESALIRTAFKEEYNDYRQRNVAKLLYIHMLGYPTHFGQMECIKLIASPRFTEKRVGYLALMLLLDERQEVLMLVTNSLQMDLNSASPYNAGLALAAIGNIGSAEIARDLANDVERLLKGGEPYVKKKAALCTIRMLRRCPELIETFLPSVVSILLDKHHNVLLTGVALVASVMEVEPAYTAKFTKLVPALVKILRKLVSAGYAAEYDVGGVTDPFLQAKILALLRVLGRGNAAASEAMNNILAQVASTIDTGKNAGNAVLYECVNTIMSVESEAGLRVLAVNILGKFLSGKDNNIKYVALQTLCKVVHVDAPAVQRHRAIIVECLKDGDISIRHRSLELVYALVNDDNVRLLAREMLTYLSVADADTRPELCVKIAAVAERYAPSKSWHIDTLVTMLSIAGDAAKREIASALLFHISHASTEDQAAVTHKLFAMASAAVLASSEAQQLLLQVAVWCVGEFGQHLLEPPPPRAAAAAAAAAASAAAAMGAGPLLLGGGPALVNVAATAATSLPADDLSGPFGERRTEAEVVRLLERTLTLYYASSELKAYVLTALVKLTGRLRADSPQLPRVRATLASFGASSDVELQSRSIEFSAMADPARTPSLSVEQRHGLVEAMPLLEEAVLRQRTGGATGEVATDVERLGGEDQQMSVVERTGEGRPRQRGAAGVAAGAASMAAAAVAAAAAGRSGTGTRAGAGAGNGTGGPGSSTAAVASLLDSLDDLFSTVSSAADLTLCDKAGSPSEVGVAAAVASASSAPARPAPSASGLDDLFGAPPAVSAPRLPFAIASSRGGIDDLFGSGSGGVSSGSSNSSLAARIGSGIGVGATATSTASFAQPSIDAGLGSLPSSQRAGTQGGSGLDDIFGVAGGGSRLTSPPAAAPASAVAAAPPVLPLVASPASSPDPFAAVTTGISAAAAGGKPGGGAGLASAAPAPAASAGLGATFVAFESASSGLLVTLRCDKPLGAASAQTDILATFLAHGAAALPRFVCQAAVPKFLKLTLLPASGDVLVPGGPAVTQLIRVENSQHGAKPLSLRLKMAWDGGTEQVDVKDQFAGL